MSDGLRGLVSILVLSAAASLMACAPTQPAESDIVADNGAAWVAACEKNDPWDKPGPPYRVYGNTYYIGTCGISSLLIAGAEGHIVIDSGTKAGVDIVITNIAALGFDIRDVKILLHSHEHFDHVGGMAKLQARSGARVVASTRAAAVLRTGVVAAKDPQANMHDAFASVTVAATVANNERVNLGALSLRALESPGHSPGALSWQWTSCEREQCKSMVYIDSLSPVSRDDYRFIDHPVYLKEYRESLARLAGIDCDFALMPHPVAGAMHQRLGTSQGLQDRNGCENYVERVKQRLDRRLTEERVSGP